MLTGDLVLFCVVLFFIISQKQLQKLVRLARCGSWNNSQCDENQCQECKEL